MSGYYIDFSEHNWAWCLAVFGYAIIGGMLLQWRADRENGGGEG